MKNQKIAIIGIGCRFPGNVENPETFWRLLQNGNHGVKEVPANRWSLDKFYDPDEEAPGKMYVKKAGFLEKNIFEFDYNFWGLSKRESVTMDPQQRLLLEVTYEALEDAGLDVQALKQTNTGVFMGSFMLDNLFLRVSGQGLPHMNLHGSSIGNATLIANRISYALDLMGPSVTIDTACSASLMAIHQACHAIRNGESDLAIAGGVNIMIHPAASIMLCKGKFLARDGRSKAFFESADGYGRGEGAGVIVLKSLEKALADNDPIYALIEGTAVNHDGKTEGISLPNKAAQIKVIEAALQASGVDPARMGYIEAHGTGTKAGDPIETGALGAVYGSKSKTAIPVGSVKVNIGHIEAAAGVAGVIKAALVLKHGAITPHPDLGPLSSSIPFDQLNLRVPLQGQSWYQKHVPEYAAVNSFGYGGANGHAILSAFRKEPVVPATNGKIPHHRVLQFRVSGKTTRALRQNTLNLLDFLEENKNVQLTDLAYTLSERKTQHDLTWIVEAAGYDELVRLLRMKLEKAEYPKPPVVKDEKLVWVFTGMGPQWHGMGRQLFKENAVFRAAVEECDAIFSAYAGYSLLEALQQSETGPAVMPNDLAQAGNFLVQIGLSEMLVAKGIPRDAIIGHSVGEIAASVVAGAITLEEGVKIIYHRGRVLQKIAGKGTLLSVGLDAVQAASTIREFPGIEIATINSPKSVTLAGTAAALQPLHNKLEAEGVFAKFVRVEVAYHSSQAAPLEEELLQSFSFVSPSLPSTPLYSTVTAKRVNNVLHDAGYWWKNVREQVFFKDTIGALIAEGFRNFIEIGPHPVLGGAIKETAAAATIPVNTFFSLKRQTDETATINLNLEEMAGAGIHISLNTGIRGSVLHLPAYAWDKELCWAEAPEIAAFRLGEESQSAFLEERVAGPYNSWKTSMNKPSLGYIKDHKVGDTIVFPGAGYISLVLQALASAAGNNALIVEQAEFKLALPLHEAHHPELYTMIDQEGKVAIHSKLANTWTTHLNGRAWTSEKYAPLPIVDVKGLFSGLNPVNRQEIYSYFSSFGLNLETAFQTLDAYKITGDRVYASVKRTVPAQDSNTIAHPTVLDGAFQSLLLLLRKLYRGKMFLPVKINMLTAFGSLPDPFYCTGKITDPDEHRPTADLQLLDDKGNVIIDIKGLTLKQTNAAGNNREWTFKYTLKPYELLSNAAYAGISIIATGDRERFNQLFGSSDLPVAFVPPSELAAKAAGAFQLIYLPATDASLSTDNTGTDCLQLISILQNLPDKAALQRLLVLTEHGLVNETAPMVKEVNVHHIAITGLARMVMIEYPDYNCRIIDLQHRPGREELKTLLRSSFEEEELVLTQAGWQQGKLVKEDVAFPQRNEQHRMQLAGHSPFKLDILQKGKPESIVFREFTPAVPAANEVQIEVQATSLNFKDVMKAMGMLNEDALKDTWFGTAFGLEGAGIITKVHPTVQHLQPGDRVYFMGNGLRSHVTIHQDYVFKLPDDISFREAATFFAYFTAWTALVELGKLKKGERVLIHAAAGGVGLAACHIAMATGADIYATAGTDEKRALLKAMGISHVYDSRSLNFYNEVLHDTNNEGVDLVLNSLAGRALQKSLDLLRSLGRFIEIGKQDITGNGNLPLMAFNKSIQFLALDIDKILPVSPQVIRGYFNNFLKAYVEKKIPTLPYKVYGLSQCSEQIRKLASGLHSGKIVIDVSDRNVDTLPEIVDRLSFAHNECVLVTGGCSGFGLRTALWLAEQGVKHLVLGSRKGTIPEEEKQVREQIESKGCVIHCIQLDVTDAASVKAAITYVHSNELQLAGLIHAAAVLEDCTLELITPEIFNRVFLPKAQGALHLHQQTSHIDLRFFIVYSSAISCVSNPGQGAYAAANCFLDGLMLERIKNGLPATSISWGSIGETGMVARNRGAAAQLKGIGFGLIPPSEGLDLMGEAIRHFQNHLYIVDLNWQQYVNSLPGSWNRMSELLQRSQSTASMPPFLASLFEVNEEQWHPVIWDAIVQLIATITGAAPDTLQPETRLSNLGFDSIMSVELVIAFQSKLGIDFPVMEILGAGTIAQLTNLAVNKARIFRERSIKKEVSGKANASVPAQKTNLTTYFLSKILVGRPYFGLTEIYRDGKGIIGKAAGFKWTDNVELNLADAGRYLAFMGSCVAADANTSEGRFCYPVKQAALDIVSHAGVENWRNMYFYAELISIDQLGSTCEAFTELRNEHGEVLASMKVSFHIIPEDGMYELFKSNMNTDPSWQQEMSDVYEETVTINNIQQHQNKWQFVMNELKPEQCVGHFRDLPAFPVSVMTRYITRLALEGQQRLDKDPAFSLQRIECDARNFAFPGEEILFTAEPEKTADTENSRVWMANTVVDTKPIAMFRVHFKRNGNPQ